MVVTCTDTGNIKLQVFITPTTVRVQCTAQNALLHVARHRLPLGIDGEEDLDEAQMGITLAVKSSTAPTIVQLYEAEYCNTVEGCLARTDPSLPLPVPTRTVEVMDMDLLVDGVYFWQGSFRKNSPGKFRQATLGELLLTYNCFVGYYPVSDEAGMVAYFRG
jgi:hypothetical protein